jgi:hypothetical protein
VRLYLTRRYSAIAMKASDEEYAKARSFLRAQLAQPDQKVDEWLNTIVDAWIATRKVKRSHKRHV